MPKYDYICTTKNCEFKSTREMSIEQYSQNPTVMCTTCGNQLVRKYTPVEFRITDKKK